MPVSLKDVDASKLHKARKRERGEVKEHVVKLLKDTPSMFTQRDVADQLTVQLKRDIRPQHARQVLIKLVEDGKVVKKAFTAPNAKGKLQDQFFFYHTAHAKLLK